MKEADFVGTWKAAGKQFGNEVNETYTFEISGKFTCVEPLEGGIDGFIAGILEGGITYGTWELNQDGTEIGMRGNDTSSSIKLFSWLVLGISYLAFPYWSKITEIDKDHVKLSSRAREETLERI